MTSYVRAPMNFAAHQRATVGDQKISFTSFDHLGWMKCDGREISRSTYALLFNVIGTTFGAGDGSTTFNLPNYAGCVPGMAGQPSFNQGVNNLTYARGAFGGEQRHQLTVPEMPVHNHGTQTATAQPATNYELTSTNGLHSHPASASTEGLHNHGGVTGETGSAPESETTAVGIYEGPVVAGSNTHSHTIASDGSHTHTITITANGDHTHTLTSQGGDQYHNNMQPTLFGGNMYIFSGRMYSGLGTYPYSAATDLA